METQVKRQYGHLDKEVYLKAREKGYNKVDAGREAGLKAEDSASIITSVNRELMKDNIYSTKDIEVRAKATQNKIDKLIEIEDSLIIEIKKPDKINQAKLGTLTLSLAQVVDKRRLLEEKSTEITELQTPDWEWEDDETPIKAEVIPSQIE